MTLDATLPSSSESTVSDLGAIGRETRTQVNANLAAIGGLGAITTVTAVPLEAAQATLITGTDVTAVPSEVLLISSDTVETLTDITLGTEGEIKILHFADSNVTLEKADAKFKLNSMGAYADFDADADDIIALLNIGGDGAGAGYWLELYRNVRVDT